MIDCHAHVFHPSRFALTRPVPASLDLGACTPERYLGVLDEHGVSNAVLVQPTTGYDHDHACLLNALNAANGRWRGIARLHPAQARAQVAILDHPLVCGVRLDLVNDGLGTLGHPDFPWLLGALRERDAVLQVQCEGDQLAAVLEVAGDAGVRIVVDHCGRPDPAAGLVQPGFAALLELGRRGHFVKLCGAFRFSRMAYPHPDVTPFVEALLATFTRDRCVWGSDWPFLHHADKVRYGQAVDLATAWVGTPHSLDAAARRLFGFTEA